MTNDHIKAEQQRYLKAAHRVQTAIASRPDSSTLTPKHLRVGIDMGKSDHAGLAALLIEKGVITMDEYVTALADHAEQEADMHERELSEHFGRTIKTI